MQTTHVFSRLGIQRLTLIVLAVACVAVTPAAAQFVSTASIDGAVSDENGGRLPGVTVTIASPALQVAQMTEVTDAQGRYRFVQLPGGVYQVRFELAGFQTLVRADVQIGAGFAAKIDAILKLGTLQETVTVSGQSPVVDVTTTTGGQTLTPDQINTLIPGSRMYGDLSRSIPGLIPTSAPNIGRLGLGSAGGFSAYGTGGTLLMIDGFQIRSNTYPDFSSAQELDIKSFGNSAEVMESGTVFNLVSKSGGNDFHGRYSEQYINDLFQSVNLDDELRAQGLSFADAVKHYSDFNSDIGGRIVRDRLWFYGNFRDRRNKRSVAGLALEPGADGLYGTGDETPHLPVVWTMNWTGKLSYQPTPKYQFVGFFARDYSTNDGGAQTGRAAQRFIPYESATYQTYNPTNWRGEFRATLSDSMLFSSQAGRVSYQTSYLATPADHGNRNLTARLDRESGIYTGGSIGDGGNYAELQEHRIRWVNQSNLTIIPKDFLGGGHELKAGYRVWIMQQSARRPDRPAGNYLLIYDRVGGLPRQPVEINTYNFPIDTVLGRTRNYGLFLNDRWQVTSRITLNLGLRYDYQYSFVPETTKPAGTFGGSGTFPEFQAERWKNWSPRLGYAMDVTGDGKTVFKATYSKYTDVMEDSFADFYNKNTVARVTYRWRDLDGNNDYTPGEVNLDPNGPDFLSTTSNANNIFNPDLVAGGQHEMTAVFDRELRSNMAARVAYVYKRNVNTISSINVLRPYSAYNIPITRRDPGPDGILNTADDGRPVTFYDYDPAFRGAAFVGNQRLNRPSDRSDYYQTMEFTVTRRTSALWGLVTSFVATKNHRWLVGIPSSPNDNVLPLDETWDKVFKISGNYRFPLNLMLSGVFDIQPGVKGARTYVFRATDPDGGTPLRQLSTVNLRLSEYGSQRGPVRPTLNLRLSKFLKLSKGDLQLAIDAINALNTNAFWGMTFESGPTFGYGTAFTSPRALQFGVTYEF